MKDQTRSNLNLGAVFWNSAGSFASAAQSFVFLIAVTRVIGAEIAGDYSIGAAIAQLMWTVGLFDQSSFLVTDTEGRFTYEQYLSFKIFSCIVMVIGSILYVFSFGYSLEKSILAL